MFYGGSMQYEEVITELNPDRTQRLAAESQRRTTLVIAGPGSGKTSTLTVRVAYLVFQQNIAPEQILALTFSRSGAREMKHRVRNQLGIDLAASTFHSFAGSQLNRYIQDSAEKLDLDSVVPRLEQLMRDDINFCKNISSSIKHVLIDEAQDLNRVQFDIIRHFSRLGLDVWIVGDPNQSIYGFQGAHPDVLSECKTLLPDCGVVTLAYNYRSLPNLVDCGGKFVSVGGSRTASSRNAVFSAAPAPTDSDSLGHIVVRVYRDFRREGEAIASAISRLIENGTPPGEIAVLAPHNYLRSYLIDALLAKEIPHFNFEGGNPNEQGWDEETVFVSSLHGAKGMEWDFVFMAQCIDSIIPGNVNGKKYRDIEEQRRVFYVGMTRARKQLGITWAKMPPRLQGTSNQDVGETSIRSRFIDDLTKHCSGHIIYTSDPTQYLLPLPRQDEKDKIYQNYLTLRDQLESN